MTPNIKGTDSSVFSVYSKKHTFYHIWIFNFPDVVHSTIKQPTYIACIQIEDSLYPMGKRNL